MEYGTTTAYGQSAPATPNPALVTTHSQALSGLTAGTVYHYRVKSRDAAGNLAVSGDFTFTTAPLVISNVAAGTAGTLYHYRVRSRDAAGNLAVSGDFTFATTQSGSIPLDGLASLSYNGANNRINTPGFEYDPAGYQTRAVINASGTQQQYRYDCAGRLAQVLDGAGNELARYSYGAGNQRLMSVEGGVTKYFAWAGGKIIAEYEAWGANALVWKKSYVYLGGQLLATTSGPDGTETQFHHPDRLGTRLVTDAGGTVVTEQLGMPFGTMLPFTQTYGGENSYQNPTLSNPSKKRFTSYDRSDVTGLHYAVNRSYSSEQGRFTQVDPIEMDAASLSDPQTLNMYAYCGNDPINHVDPDGLFWGAIGRFFKAIGIAIATFFGSGGGVSSGPGFRTPPTFPGSLPGINAAIRSGMGGFRTPPFVNGFLQTQQTQDDSWGAWFERLGNKLSGNGWKTNREVEDDRYRAKTAKQKEANAWLRAHGFPEELIGGLSVDEQIALYEKAKNGEPININIIPAPALSDDPYHPDQVRDRVRPPYRANPAHQRGPQFNPRKTPEPTDAARVYENSVRADMGTWYGRGANGKIYRYFSDNAGGTHFSGIVPKSQVPKAVLKELGF